MKKDRLSKICEVVIDFYRIRGKFEKEFRYYRKEGKFRFETIDALESELYHLKSKTHDAFRYDPDSKSKILESEDLFDLIVGSIFHEALHLKEYVYTLQSYAPRYVSFAARKKDRQVENHQNNFLKYSREIVREAMESLPKKVAEVKNLFEDALSLVVRILKKHRASKRIIRILYLERELMNSVYGENGLEYIYKVMYKDGPMEGYFHVGASFLKSGFYDLAAKAFEESLNACAETDRRNELCMEIKKKCQFLEKKQPGITKVQKILARIG